MTEAEFVDAIDFRFPYDDETRALELIALGCELSDNAAFMIVHELARPAGPTPPSRETLLRYLDAVRARCSHPALPLVAWIATRMIEGRSLPAGEALDAMQAIAAYPDQYNALAIARFSATPRDGAALTDEEDDRLDSAYDVITFAWRGRKDEP